MQKIKVLIADDHALMREGIRALLGVNDDIEVIGEASNGKEAIDRTRELAPDIVVMDLAMPVMDGIEATRLILKKNPAVRVLVLTQHDKKDYILSAIKAGAAGFVPKRALGTELLSALRTIHMGNSALYPSAASALVEEYRQRGEGEPFDRLTARERQILKLIADGRTSQAIADTLTISLKTVLGHRTKIMEKLDIHNRSELIKFALRKGLIDLET